jgi:hypothetical protein
MVRQRQAIGTPHAGAMQQGRCARPVCKPGVPRPLMDERRVAISQPREQDPGMRRLSGSCDASSGDQGDVRMGGGGGEVGGRPVDLRPRGRGRRAPTDRTRTHSRARARAGRGRRRIGEEVDLRGRAGGGQGRGPVGELEVQEDGADDGGISEEREDAHLAAARRAHEGKRLVDPREGGRPSGCAQGRPELGPVREVRRIGWRRRWARGLRPAARADRSRRRVAEASRSERGHRGSGGDEREPRFASVSGGTNRARRSSTSRGVRRISVRPFTSGCGNP